MANNQGRMTKTNGNRPFRIPHSAFAGYSDGMSDVESLARSPELMNRDDTALLVVDMQARLLPLIAGHARIIWNIRRLIDGAKILGVPFAATEQYPQGLGPTTPELAALLGSIPAK